MIEIVREEMDAAGAIELLMPALQPVELWKESGRYEAYGDLLMKLTISGGHQMALGPTHEEVITDMVRDLIRSYKQLPITLYQIQTKFRDEPRPRFGIVRTREFIMKDAYSIDADLAQLNQSYDAMYEAYCRIFDRCGVPYVIVEAESGPIGGDSSHEFMVPCSTGEDKVIQCVACGYAANQERAEIGAARKSDCWTCPRKHPPTRPSRRPTSERSATSASFSEVDETTSAKAARLSGRRQAGGRTRARRSRAQRGQAPPGDRSDRYSCRPTRPRSRRRRVLPWVFWGPSAIKIPLVIDRAIAAMPTVVVGGNAVDVHLKGVVPGRDFPLEQRSRRAERRRRRSRARAAGRHSRSPRAWRSATSSSSAPSIPSRWGRLTSTRRGTRSSRDHGLLRHRHQPDRRRCGRGGP